MYLSAITVEINQQHSLTFQEFSTLLNQRCAGLQQQRDLAINYDKDRFMISGLTPKASQPIAELARIYNLTILRLDLTFCEVVSEFQQDRAKWLDWEAMKKRLHSHLETIKYRGHYLQTTRFDVRSFEMGAEKSDKQLFLRDRTDPPASVPALQIVWRLRGHHARAAWQWVYLAEPSEVKEGIDLAFCAATNTFLGPDWFHLGHDQRASLQKEAKPAKPKAEPDWHQYIDMAFEILRKKPGASEPFDTCTLISDYVFQKYCE
jgi:hypothetical protein